MKKSRGSVTMVCMCLPMFFFSSLYPFIYEIVVLKRLNEKTRKTQYFIGLSDFHDKKNNANAEQLAGIKEFLKSQNKHKTKLILEDLSTHSDNCRNGACRQFQINSRGGILGGLAFICHKQGLYVDNIEYRYCRVAALGPLLNNKHKKAHDFPSACGVTVSDIAREVRTAIEDVAKSTTYYAELKFYCKKILKKIKNQIKKLYLMQDSKNSMADYVQRHSKENTRHELLKQLLTFDSTLLDLKLARSILAADEFDVIIAITGGSHITRTQEILLSVGYEPIFSKSSSQNAKKKPQPIDFSSLKTLFHSKLNKM